MFVQVRLLNGFEKPLLYQWPASFQDAQLGTVVRVCVRNQIMHAVVTEIVHNAASYAFKIKPIISIEPFPHDQHYYQFITTLARYYQTDPLKLIQLVRHFLRQRKDTTSDALIAHALDEVPKKAVILTDEQQHVTQFLTSALNQQQFCPTVLHGVTGSGKTEVYKKLLETTITAGKSAILLLPEVTLALRMAHIMREQLPSIIPLYSFHSGSSAPEKLALWQRLVHTQPTVIIGVHMPVILPITQLGLIIVDEEHEVGYQEKKHPKINSKDAAILRAHMLRIPILLGSATPSISSLYNVKKRGWHFFQLKERFAGSLATVSTVFMQENKQQRRNFWISRELDKAIGHCLAKKEQAIIFINRRGYSFFVQCSACSFIFTCKNCSVSLTLHDGSTLSCHYCGTRIQQPRHCTACTASDETFIKKGIGTQQVVSIIQKLFPQARIARADMDMTVKKKAWQKTIDNFHNGNIDILIGTQTIAKGFHFPNVTLVGVIWADLNLHFPIYNASETCLQQLIQVAGRAGRQRKNSHVIMQTMTDHRIFRYLDETAYLQFYADELQARLATHYPPSMRLAEIEIKNTNQQQIEDEAHAIADALHTYAQAQDITILGPAQPPVHMIQRVHCRKIYLKANSLEPLIKAFEGLEKTRYASSLFFTPNPTH